MLQLPDHLGGHANVTHIDEGALLFFRSLGCQSLLDVGCGPGKQVELANKLGYCSMGIDGDWSLLGPNYLLVCDFTKGQIKFPWKFDLIWSVEVAEHISKDFELNFLKSCVENCAKYFLLTASTNERPRKHVNVEPNEYWIDKVSQLGMTYDECLTLNLKGESTMKREFIRNNGMVFRVI